MLIAAPVILILEHLARGEDDFVPRVRRLAESYEQGSLHRIYFTPGVLLVPLATPTVPPATHTNTYIVGHKKLYVIDPAPIDPVEQAKLWDFLEELRADGKSLEGILLTHHHTDHVGAVAECQRRYELPVYGHAETARLLPEIRFRAHLADGQEIDLGESPDGREGWKLRAYHTPGHAPGHLAFQENRYRALLAGDLVSTLSSILIDPDDGHLRAYMESLRFSESIAEGVVYPSHGPAARDGRGAIQGAIRHRQDRERQILEALGTDPQSADELVKKVYTDVDESVHGLAKRSLLSGLLKLQEEGRVRPMAGGYCLIT